VCIEGYSECSEDCIECVLKGVLRILVSVV
jgi:hypothetical protein